MGRYVGLKTLDVTGAPHDCLQLEYAGGDTIFLPVENIDLISRYGSEESESQLDRLGGAGWQTRKAKAKKRILEMAAELMAIAAARELKRAEVVNAGQGLYEEFAARFPYEETDDQLNAIEDVLGDLGSGRPMDRLICGDVGFGKTEVALRAAFVAAMAGHRLTTDVPDQYRYFRLSETALDELRRATDELHAMFMHATQVVLNDDKLLALFNIPEVLWPRLRVSWEFT